jgi:phage tail sheath protein FI
MALKFSESPAVRVREIDLSGIVPAVTSSTGAFVGDFGWGPVNTPVLVGNESELASTFGTPLSGSNAADFLSVAQFLKYSSSAFVVRVDNDSNTADDGVFSAKYPGELGNLVSVHVCDADHWVDTSDTLVQARDSDGLPIFNTVPVLESDGTPAVDSDGEPVTQEVPVMVNPPNPWEYQDLFSSAPEGNERHVVVIFKKGSDEESVLETYEYVSTSPTAKLANGSTNYIVDVINAGSSWVEIDGLPAKADYTLIGGSNGTSPNFVTAYGLFADKDTIQIDFLVPPVHKTSTPEEKEKALAVQVELVSIAEQRKDCVAVVSSTTAPTTAQDVLDHAAALNQNSSYLVVDGNWLKVYDKYNDVYITLPAASSTAGVMAATDAASAPWFSPAGSRRGQYLGVTDIAINPSKSQRDALYKAGVNPIVSFPGQGIMLYGDKTHLSRPSAFDRINVRRLFLVIERAIAEAAQNVMFEFNDEFTRAEFVNIVEPFLREIQGRRGITDFRLVCDTTNNTSEVIDRNEFVASCFIKPARSINYVTLNFVAVRSGVNFEEVVGTSGV